MKKFRHLWLSILTLVLSVSIIIGGAGLSAFAATATGTEIISSSVVLPASVYLGEEVDVKVGGVTVTAPNGKTVTVTENKFVAEMLGNYTVEYKSGEKTYTHTVNVTLKSDYELRVVGDGAAIPTYTNTEKEYTLPAATLYKKNDDGEYEPMKDSEYTLKVYINNEEKNIADKQKFSLGKNSVQYDAVIAGTQKHFTKQYDVNAQMSFEDKVRPTISISGVPTDASLNTMVTLPKATATDNFDANVQINVTVSFEGKPVKKVSTNKYGYADKTLEADETFDNVYDTTFYPREQGTYVVEYQAIDDAGNVSVKQPFNIKVQDRTAPKLESIADDQIPATWGLAVVKESNDTNSGDIVFPYPEYSDNNTDNITVSFEIRDTVNNNTVIRFENIYDYDKDGNAGSGAKYKYDSSNASKGLYDSGEEVTFTKDGFKFNFNDYKLASDLTKTGKYTAIYNARDKKPNSTTKSYDIELQDTFTDKIAPSVELNADKYIYVSDVETKYELPTATVSDAIDSKPSVEYTVKIGEKSIVVENGEEIAVWSKDGKVFVKYSGNEDGEEFVMANTATLTVTAKDDVGNIKSESKEITLAVVGDFVDSNVKLSIDNALTTATVGDFKLGDAFNLGSLTIGSFDIGYRDFVGFEMYMTNPDGDIIDGLDFETYVNPIKDNSDGKYQITVDNLTFVPAQKTDATKKYVLTVRAFDITGRSVVQAFEITVNVTGEGNKDELSAVAIPNSGNINVAYRLRNETYKATGVQEGRKYIVRRVSNAGRFSLMGIEFTAYTTGTVSFTDGYYKADGSTAGGVFKSIGEKYSLKATDSSSIEFDVIGLMPVQAVKAEKTADYKNDLTKWVKLPEVIAYNEFANADVTVKVTTPSTSGINRTYSFDPKQNNNEDSEYIQYAADTNQYYFFAMLDGEYKVEYSASVGGAASVQKTFSIRVGDTVPPTFTVEGNNYGATARQNGSFQFKTVKLGAEDQGDIADITFTKRLLDPSGNEVYSVSDKGTTGANKTTPSKDETYTFTMTGTYTVEYTTTDKAGNASVYQDTINVSATDSTGAMPLKVLRTVLIIVGAILIAGVILYFVRFRKVKESDVKKK